MDQDIRGATARLSAWAAELQHAAIPPDVVARAKLCLLDGIGCGLFGSTQPWAKIAADMAAELSGGGPASLWGQRASASAADAALVNGTAIHGYEIDDFHLRALLHTGAVTVPAVLALAEAKANTGRELLTALVAGYEVGLRVGIGAGVAHSLRGYHPTGTVGCLAAGAGVANLLKLSSSQALHALGIAATQAAGLYSAVRAGAMTKRMHAGRAAQSGVIAGLLAQRGFTGSPDVLEAPSGGFMSTLTENTDWTQVVASLGREWEISHVGFKAYAACASAHTTIDAVGALMKRGLTKDNLQRLTIRMSAIGVNNVGWEYRPTSVVGSQMNGYFAAAVKLNDGDAFIDQYREDRIADPAILALISKIEIRHDPELDLAGAAKRHAVKVEARSTDGQVWHEYVEQCRGSPHHPLSRTEIEDKFRRTAGSVLDSGAIEALLENVHELEHAADLRAFFKVLRDSV